jgi:hypothetical protein
VADSDGRAVKGHGYISARTDTTQQTNICLGIHFQICVATFNSTSLLRLLPKKYFFFSVCFLLVSASDDDDDGDNWDEFLLRIVTVD